MIYWFSRQEISEKSWPLTMVFVIKNQLREFYMSISVLAPNIFTDSIERNSFKKS